MISAKLSGYHCINNIIKKLDARLYKKEIDREAYLQLKVEFLVEIKESSKGVVRTLSNI